MILKNVLSTFQLWHTMTYYELWHPMTPHRDSIRDVAIIHFPVTETAPDEFPGFFLFWQQRVSSFCRPIPQDSAAGLLFKEVLTSFIGLQWTKSSLHYTSFIVSSWFGNYSKRKLGWSLLRIHFNWYRLGVCFQPFPQQICTPTLVILTNNATVRLNPSCFDGFNLFGLRKSCKVWLLWQKKTCSKFHNVP